MYIFINDLRPVPLLTALILHSSIGKSQLIAHEGIFKNREYADYTFKIWKLLLLFALKYIFGAKIIKTKEASLSEEEKIGLYSSLVSITEDSSATRHKYPDQYEELYNLAIGSKLCVEYCAATSPTAIYVFNGRVASSYLLARWAVKTKTPICYYEFAGHCNGFRLFPVSPHASGSLGVLLEKYYIYGIFDAARITEEAGRYKVKKLSSRFVEGYKLSPNERYDVSIFLGSDYEYAWIDPLITGLEWKGNLDFVARVVKKYGPDRSYVVRCHPNSIVDPNWKSLDEELRQFASTCSSRMDVIGANEPVDSHKLIQASGVVVTAYSSISIDAILLGAKVDIFGDSDIKRLFDNEGIQQRMKTAGNFSFAEPFALGHNFLVFRFSRPECWLCNILYYLTRLQKKLRIAV